MLLSMKVRLSDFSAISQRSRIPDCNFFFPSFGPASGCFPFFLPFHRLLSWNQTIKLESCTPALAAAVHRSKELVCSASVCEHLFIYLLLHNWLFCWHRQAA